MTIFELSQRAPEIYAKATPEEKRRLLSLVFSSLIIENNKIHFEYTEPFKILADAVEATNSSKVFKSIKSPIQIFELLNEGSIKTSLSNLDTVCPSLLPGRGSVTSNFPTENSLDPGSAIPALRDWDPGPPPFSPLPTGENSKSPMLSHQALTISCCPAGARTPISWTKTRRPTIRRPGSVSFVAKYLCFATLEFRTAKHFYTKRCILL